MIPARLQRAALLIAVVGLLATVPPAWSARRDHARGAGQVGPELDLRALRANPRLAPDLVDQAQDSAAQDLRVVVRYRKGSSAAALARKMGATLVRDMPRLRTAILDVAPRGLAGCADDDVEYAIPNRPVVPLGDTGPVSAGGNPAVLTAGDDVEFPTVAPFFVDGDSHVRAATSVG